jgi:hypothetical protein
MRGFFHRLDQIDDVVARGASEENALALLSLMANLASTVYGLDKLDAKWLEPLESLGYFRDQTLSATLQGAAHTEFWPASAYLKKAAAHARDDSQIAQTLWRILSFLPTPREFRTVRDIIEITIMLPPAMRRGVVPLVQRVLSRADNLEFANVSALVNSLALDGEVPSAIRLFLTVFAAIRDDGAAEAKGPLIEHAKTFMDPWNYREEMKRCLATLTKQAGTHFIRSLCQLLNDYLRISANAGFQGPDDYSYVWRPAIEEHEQNIHDDPRDTVVTAIRDCVVSSALESPSTVEELLGILDSQQWHVFTRIMLHLLAQVPSAHVNLISKYLTDPYLFSEVGVRHEYAELLRYRFGMLSADQGQQVMKMIGNGPDEVSYATFIQREFGRPATEQEISKYSEHWELEWLSIIEKDLSSEWRERYEGLKGRVEQPEHPEFPYYSRSGFISSESGLSAEVQKTDLESLLVRFDPSEQKEAAPSYDDARAAGDSLRNATEDDLNVVIRRSEEIVRLPIELVNVVASALLSPAEGSERATLAALTFGVSVARRAAEVENGDRERFLELGTQMISYLVHEKENRVTLDQIPILRTIVTELLVFVRTDGRAKRGINSSDFDPFTQSINTLDGHILESAIKVALLERRMETSEQPPDPNWLLNRLSDLLRRLDPNEQWVTSILGYRFPWFVHLSRLWAAEHSVAIFPLSPSLKGRWNSAWYSYAIYSGAYDDVFQILKPQYSKAIRELTARAEGKRARREPESGLAQHLAAYYWRRKLSIGEPIFRELMTRGNEAVVSTFLAVIGRAIRDVVEIPPEALKASRELAEWMTRKWRPRKKEAKKAMSALGWWATSPSLGDPKWRLTLLRRAAVLAGSIQNPDQVLKFLEEQASSQPDLVVGCLSALAFGAPNESGVYYLATRSEAILDKVTETGSHTSAEQIRELADHFGSMGNFQYRRFAKAV